MQDAPVIIWFRRDLRLGDHAALSAAAATRRPVIPVFLHDETVEALGAAAKWRLGTGLRLFAEALAKRGSRLVLRRGRALDLLKALVGETGAGAVYWSRVYDPAGITRDKEVKAALTAGGIEAKSFPGAVLFEPWTVETQSGGPYSVYSPFWRNIRGRDPGPALDSPNNIKIPSQWPESEDLSDWGMGEAMNRGAAVAAGHAVVGEGAAQARLERFVEERMTDYREARDIPARDATSGLSENLAWGEISARSIWQRAIRAREEGNTGADKFLSELGWRDFACHLMYHHPKLADENWRDGWDSFPWREDNDDAERWRRGMTGEPFVDAAMREMYVTGRMHNRARMIAASYLTKHLMTHWHVGLRWFAECLTDWDPASNAMGWQWVAGSGPDAAPYFRIFNPDTQAKKFDPREDYRRAFIAEGQADPPDTALSYFDAIPRSWGLSADQNYPEPIVDLAEGRARALDTYERQSSNGG
ncbi:Deoxyribodipyrimidine photo-lyase [Defluviimonas aquaemixtae]|uniref:Deoxyribodipyrimidine photo-lyase n=1 Tax=Albidovulum aquaemixtae TaxID=1542388 RepID=A0A2R8B6U1_9RHOB|nr:deoxyribodipyrimidine photo-lyase [Defluviimonas aquaemixtae]SPH18286.1 Deoxyribodipyrimidine photo-lyase [Defluviimonas aquaemixtae]